MSGPIKVHIIRNAATYDLWRVAETGGMGQLLELLARGADVNAGNDVGVTALMIAASHGRFEMVRALTNHGADVNATDSDGLTAVMMADSAGHADIVSFLMARGARGIAKRNSSDTSSTNHMAQQTPVSLAVSDTAKKRVLVEPPNIWDVVRETHVDFDPRSAFFGHLRSINPHVFALVALIVGGGAILGFIWLRGWSGTAPAVKTESGYNPMVQSSPVNAPDNTAASSDQQSGSQTTEPVAAESPPSQPSPMTPGNGRLAGVAASAKTAVATPREPAKRVAAKSDQPAQSIPTPAGSATVTNTKNLDNPEKAKTPITPAAGSDNKKSVEPIFRNKEPVKVPSPAPAAPARVRPTPNS